MEDCHVLSNEWEVKKKKVKTVRAKPTFNNLREKKNMEQWTEKCIRKKGQ